MKDRHPEFKRKKRISRKGGESDDYINDSSTCTDTGGSRVVVCRLYSVLRLVGDYANWLLNEFACQTLSLQDKSGDREFAARLFIWI